jgi:predicted metal-dependent peptidase
VSQIDRDASDRALAAAQSALRSASMLLPHLAGLAQLVRLSADIRISTAGVFASGRLVVNPGWFLHLQPPARIFVIAHEIMHLALRTHERSEGSDARLFNIAHDYIINDMLRNALAMDVPAQGLDWRGAEKLSAERIVAELRARQARGENLAHEAWSRPHLGAVGEALVRAGLRTATADHSALAGLDALDERIERLWFPGEPQNLRLKAQKAVAASADRALALAALRGRMDRAFGVVASRTAGSGGGQEALISALDARYRPAWELALQRWLEDVAPGVRSYGRASRRQGDRTDIVVVGRRREGWTLNLVLDTSGSMMDELATIFGLLKAFCLSVGVASVRILQCDQQLRSDETVDSDTLDRFRVTGLEGSDLSPAMRHLARDPDVEAALVITDGDIAYPAEPMPYAVLWTVMGSYPFHAPYGHVIRTTAEDDTW